MRDLVLENQGRAYLGEHRYIEIRKIGFSARESVIQVNHDRVFAADVGRGQISGVGMGSKTIANVVSHARYALSGDMKKRATPSCGRHRWCKPEKQLICVD